MQRDLDLIREILLKVEADHQLNGRNFAVFDGLVFRGYTDEEVVFQVKLLTKAGFLDAESRRSERPSAAVSGLTWKGHEFLDSIKHPDIWTKVKERAVGLKNLPVTALAAMAQAEIRKRLPSS